jgi:hypothetical protein
MKQHVDNNSANNRHLEGQIVGRIVVDTPGNVDDFS